MKLICVMNGWKDASQYWWRYLLIPIWIKHYRLEIYTIEALGFVFWIDARN